MAYHHIFGPYAVGFGLVVTKHQLDHLDISKTEFRELNKGLRYLICSRNKYAKVISRSQCLIRLVYILPRSRDIQENCVRIPFFEPLVKRSDVEFYPVCNSPFFSVLFASAENSSLRS